MRINNKIDVNVCSTWMLNVSSFYVIHKMRCLNLLVHTGCFRCKRVFIGLECLIKIIKRQWMHSHWVIACLTMIKSASKMKIKYSNQDVEKKIIHSVEESSWIFSLQIWPTSNNHLFISTHKLKFMIFS